MEWIYGGKRYRTADIDWETLYDGCPDNMTPVKMLLDRPRVAKGAFEDREYPVVYNSAWDKCFLLCCFRRAGNRSARLSAWVADVYRPAKCCVCQCSKLSLVEEVPARDMNG